MPGLPFGAARQRAVPQDVQDYEHITSIEFIEIDVNSPYPRSVAYRPVESGGQVRVRDKGPECCDVDLTQAEARAYIDGLVQAGVFAWQRIYRPAQGTFVVAGCEWRLEIEFATPKGAKRVRPFRVEGEETTPDTYEQVIAALMDVDLPEVSFDASDAQTQE